MRFPERLSLAEARDSGLLAELAARWGTGGTVIGVTGGAGVGKSSLVAALVDGCRRHGVEVGVLAVDPRSASGGALLGDRIRMTGSGAFVRSVSGGEGGLSDRVDPMLQTMRDRFAITLLETVGVGQFDADVVDVADRTMLALQPGAGDEVQAMKGGVVELVDALVATKSDTGRIPRQWTRVPVFSTSVLDGSGIDDLVRWLVEVERAEDWEARTRSRAMRLLEREYGARARRLVDSTDATGAPWEMVRAWAETADATVCAARTINVPRRSS